MTVPRPMTVDDDAWLPACGARVCLRRLRPADLHRFQAYRTDPDVGRYQGWAVLSDEQARVFLEDVAHAPLFAHRDWSQLAIVDRLSDELIGDVGVLVDHAAASAEIGFTLARPWQHRGLAREAVALAIDLLWVATAVRRVVGVTDARNVAAQRLLMALGFVMDGEGAGQTRGEPAVELTFARVRTGPGPSVGPATTPR